MAKNQAGTPAPEKNDRFASTGGPFPTNTSNFPADDGDFDSAPEVDDFSADPTLEEWDEENPSNAIQSPAFKDVGFPDAEADLETQESSGEAPPEGQPGDPSPSPSEGEAAPQGDDSEAFTDPTWQTPAQAAEAARYFQADRDRVKNELARLQQERDELAALRPLAERLGLLNGNPATPGQPAPPQPQNGQQTSAPSAPEPAPERPKRPAPPRDLYDEEAQARYAEELATYETQYEQYMERRLQQQIGTAKQQLDTQLQQVEARRHQATLEAQARQQLQFEYGLTPQETDDFMRNMDQLRSDADLLVEAYKLRSRRSAEQDPEAVRKQQAREAAARRAEQRPPATATSHAGRGAAPTGDSPRGIMVESEDYTDDW